MALRDPVGSAIAITQVSMPPTRWVKLHGCALSSIRSRHRRSSCRKKARANCSTMAKVLTIVSIVMGAWYQWSLVNVSVHFSSGRYGTQWYLTVACELFVGTYDSHSWDAFYSYKFLVIALFCFLERREGTHESNWENWQQVKPSQSTVNPCVHSLCCKSNTAPRRQLPAGCWTGDSGNGLELVTLHRVLAAPLSTLHDTAAGEAF